MSGNNDDKKDSKPNNETNNSAEVNDSSNDNTNNQTNNNSDNTTNNNSSDDPAPLNSFANIGGNVEMKVNHTYVEDTYYFVTRVTFKNNGTTDVTLNAPGFDPEFVYFGAYFVPKSVGIANATEKDLISESCNLRKIVRSDGIETTITSGDTENTLLHAGETLDAMVNCTITRVEGNASGVEPVMFYTTHYPNSNEKVETTFNIKNSLQQ